MQVLVGVGAAAAGLSYLAVGAFRQWALRRNIMDVPNARSSHKRPTPRGGGLAIVAITLLGMWAMYLAGGLDASPRALLLYTAGAALIAAVSWMDDVGSLPIRIRFAAHTVGAFAALVAFGYWDAVGLPPFGSIAIGSLGMAVPVLWVVGMVNADNLMGGVDGIAGSPGVVAGLAWCAVGLLGGHPLVATVGALVAGASLGFLGHNWSPARIFMGDVGSTFLGYTLATLPLMLNASGSGERDWSVLPLVSLLVLWPFVFDTIFTLVRRLSRGEDILAAHRSHLYQRLAAAGLGHRRVASLYAAMAVVGLALAIALVNGAAWAGWAALLWLPVGPVAVALFADARERAQV